ncbi:DUF4129 domain-containing protein [Myxacorys almedinensis]|uniref:DUF4129 domain-containing protein n=1 Tax=Myxacorys almedinensis A TaxID=2690445 RepID=A0A8J7Z419_9CYAN|nr:DUF4129 domain-containing protein [Myxacorys almedinensis]NDJ17791.1 DUF4129 domain-containing protein [Myxacorys almedinensis A]
MTAGTFQRDSLDWQLQKVWWRIGEWIELHSPKFDMPTVPDVPQWDFPRQVFRVAFWLIVALLLLWLGWQLYRWLSPYLDPKNPKGAQRLYPRADSTAQDRPIALWLAEVQRFQTQGNYREACRALYMAMLQRLNDGKLVPHQASRTDREYWQLVQRLPRSHAYQTLLRTHEQLCFGNAAISVETFNQCQQAYGDLERSPQTSDLG